MSYAGNQLAYCGHLLAMQQLLLRPPQIVVCLTRLLVQQRPFDRVRSLAADRDQEIYIGRRELPRRARSHDKCAHHAVLRPEDDDVGRDDQFFTLCFTKYGRQRQSLRGKKRRVDGFDVMEQLLRYFRRWKAFRKFRTMTDRGNPADYVAAIVEQIKRRRVQAKQLDDLPQRAMNRIHKIQRLGQRLRNRVQDK